MKEECLICKAPLEYLEADEMMECVLCHKKEPSKTRCVNGHYVCNDCHTKGMDTMITLCLNERSRDPVDIIEEMMTQPFCHMHGPEHHVMVGSALLTAYPEKTENGTRTTSFACAPDTADAEFALSKREYCQLTGRSQESDVIAYQVRQSFRPGEITPEETNRIGYEFADRLRSRPTVTGSAWAWPGLRPGDSESDHLRFSTLCAIMAATG